MQIGLEAALGIVGVVGGLIGALIMAAENRGAMRQGQKNLRDALLGDNGVCHRVETMVDQFNVLKGRLENGLLKRVDTMDLKIDALAKELNEVKINVGALQVKSNGRAHTDEGG